MSGRPVSSAQRLAAKALGVDLPPVEADPHTRAQQALETAARKKPGGWSTGGPKEVVKASRAAVQARRGQSAA